MTGQLTRIALDNGRSTLGVPMTGDPVFDPTAVGPGADPLMCRRACQYATAMLRRSGRFKGDLSYLDAQFRPPATVLFISADRKQRVVARYVVPDRVMAFQPEAAPVRMLNTAIGGSYADQG